MTNKPHPTVDVDVETYTATPYFKCECGHELPMDTVTECGRCGAHYHSRRGTMVQQAPPQQYCNGCGEPMQHRGNGFECTTDGCGMDFSNE